MKQRFALLFFLLPALLSAQTNNVIINANLKGLKAGTWVYYNTYYPSIYFPSTNDSVKSVANGFHVMLNIPEGDGNMFIVRIGAYSDDNNKTTYLYLDKGIVTITGNNPNFKDATITGTPYVNEYSAYMDFLLNNPLLKNADTVYKKYYDAEDNKDSVAVAALKPRLAELDSIGKTVIKQWVNEHPNSPMSASILLTDLKDRVSWADMELLLNQLSTEAKNNIPAKDLLKEIEVDKLTGIGKTAPDFTQPDTLNHTVSLKDFRGKYVLVDFWASWCTPCREENPNVVKAYNDYKDKNFTVLSISMDDDKSKWLQAIHKDGMPWSHASDLKGFDSNAAAKQYNIESIPSNILIDPSGKILAKNLRGEALESKLAEVLKN